MSKHTEGPWYFKPADPWEGGDGAFVQHGCYHISSGAIDVHESRYYRIGEVSNVNNSDQNEANARLIAAAPELLDALREAECALSLMHSYGHCGRDSYTGARDVAQVRAGEALANASAAIAKATGDKQ